MGSRPTAHVCVAAFGARTPCRTGPEGSCAARRRSAVRSAAVRRPTACSSSDGLQPAGEDQPDAPSRRRSAKASALADERRATGRRRSRRRPASVRSQAEHVAYGHGERAVVGGLVRGLVKAGARPPARAAAAGRARRSRRRGRRREGLRARRRRGHARPRRDATREHSGHAGAPPRQLRATASTSRFLARPRARRRRPVAARSRKPTTELSSASRPTSSTPLTQLS